jgi:hypothetical protein
VYCYCTCSGILLAGVSGQCTATCSVIRLAGVSASVLPGDPGDVEMCPVHQDPRWQGPVLNTVLHDVLSHCGNFIVHL